MNMYYACVYTIYQTECCVRVYICAWCRLVQAPVRNLRHISHANADLLTCHRMGCRAGLHEVECHWWGSEEEKSDSDWKWMKRRALVCRTGSLTVFVFCSLMFAGVIHTQVISRSSRSVQVEQFCIKCLDTIWHQVWFSSTAFSTYRSFTLRC